MTYVKLPNPSERDELTRMIVINGRTLPSRFQVDFDGLELKAPTGGKFGSENELKEWVWANHRDTFIRAMRIKYDDEQSELVKNKQRLDLLEKVAYAQRQYLQSEGPKVVYNYLLEGIRELMKSEYGFIGEVKYNDDGTMYLLTHAITDISWDEPTRKFYRDNVEKGLKFYNLNTLFGKVLTSKEPVVSNDPKTDSRAAGIPKGHPPLNHFLGIPFFNKAGDILGMVGLANKPGGYSEADIEFLEPFTITCSNLIKAYWQIEENKELINTLEEKVKERTHKLQAANEQLEEANRRVVKASEAQLQHFACMSHEIRTPLNCVVGLSSLLLETKLDAMQKESMRMIVTSGDLLLTVVNDVLDYSKLETGNVEFDIKRSNLQETLNAVVHSIELKAQDKNIALVTYYEDTVPEFIRTDCRRLQQILYNLLGNAVKFSKNGGVVELSVVLSKVSDASTRPVSIEAVPRGGNDGQLGTSHDGCPFRTNSLASETDQASSSRSTMQAQTVQLNEGNAICFIVKDYGKGIDRKDYDAIFQPFRQANSETEQVYGGTGLGLAITSNLVHGLGGKISVDSVVGEWAEFTVALPFADTPVNVELVASNLRSSQILLCDLVGSNRERICQLFDRLAVKYQVFDSMEALVEVFVASEDNLATVVLINEDLYQKPSHERLLVKQLRPVVLLSFGPKFSVESCNGHYRSLTNVIPSVLIASLHDYSQAAFQRIKSTDLPTHCASVNSAVFRDMRILVAEDNIVNIKVLSRILERLGIVKCEHAENGLKAVELEASKPFDVILMDMQMPVMDGLEACRQIVTRKGGHPVPPIIFVTAHVSSSFEAICAKAGASGFLSKPFNVREIEGCLQRVCGQEMGRSSWNDQV